MQFRLRPVMVSAAVVLHAVLCAATAPAQSAGFTSNDLYRFRSVGEVALSPDGHRIAYTVTMFDRPGRPYSQLWIMDLATQHSVRVGGGQETGSEALWSPDGRSLASIGGQGEQPGLTLATANGAGGAPYTPGTAPQHPL